MHRKLDAEGTSFSALLDAARRELAGRYIEGSDRALTDVAALLGFAAPSAFSRWYRSRFGLSAARRRAAAAGPRRPAPMHPAPAAVHRRSR